MVKVLFLGSLCWPFGLIYIECFTWSYMERQWALSLGTEAAFTETASSTVSIFFRNRGTSMELKCPGLASLGPGYFLRIGWYHLQVVWPELFGLFWNCCLRNLWVILSFQLLWIFWGYPQYRDRIFRFKTESFLGFFLVVQWLKTLHSQWCGAYFRSSLVGKTHSHMPQTASSEVQLKTACCNQDLGAAK